MKDNSTVGKYKEADRLKLIETVRELESRLKVLEELVDKKNGVKHKESKKGTPHIVNKKKKMR